MKDNYINLSTLNFGKHSYNIIRNNDKIVYFENENGKYLIPIISFNLYDNEGKSLTSVNQHFFMSQLINRINLACKKGIFVSDDEIVEYLNNLKLKIENDSFLKKLFKGSLMKEIDEDNFEKNKKELLDYLDKYRFDTFVDYNNVSIFNGSLDKNDSSDNQESVASNSVETLDLDTNVLNEEVTDGLLDEDGNSVDFVQEVDNITTDSEPAINANEFFGSSNDQQNVDVLESNESTVDLAFESNSSFSDQPMITEDKQVNELDISNQNMVVNNEQNSEVNNSINVQNAIVDNKQFSEVNNTNYNNVNTIESNASFVQIDNVLNSSFSDNTNIFYGNDSQPALSNEIGAGVNVQSSDNLDNTLSSNSSYLDQVKSRIENKSLNVSKDLRYDNEIGILDTPVDELNLDKTFVSDKDILPELDKVVDEEVVETTKKKGNAGFVVFIIILVVLLILFTFFLYNYVF